MMTTQRRDAQGRFAFECCGGVGQHTLPCQVKKARLVSTPLIAISTPDQANTLDVVKGIFLDNAKTPIPIIKWDALNGFTAINESGRDTIVELLKTDKVEEWPGLSAAPATALGLASLLPGEQRDTDNKITQRGSILFMHNAHLFFEDKGDREHAQVVQGIWNLRDLYKSDKRTLIILGPAFTFPPEIGQDVIEFDEPLPDEEEQRRLIAVQIKYASLPDQPEAIIGQAVDAIRGLPAFTAEQIVAMSLTKDGVDMDALWSRKISVIEQIPGLTIDRGGESFDDVGGLEQFKKFGLMLIQGPQCPLLFVRFDELEKMLGGIGTQGVGDNTGVSQDSLGVILRVMEDEDWPGLIALGPPGTGKSLVTKSLANTASKVLGRKVLSLATDLGAMKGGIVGESEKKIRAAMKAIKALGGKGRVCFVATCNKLEVLPPELRRRFRLGIWMFDIPEDTEKAAVWSIMAKRYDLEKNIASGDKPDDTDWTQAEIRNVCDIKTRLGCSLTSAAQFIVPVAKSDPESVERLRTLAHGRFLSASYTGAYQKKQFKVNQPARGARARGEE